MKITVLLENTKRENSPLIAEHGLSLFLEYNGLSYLLDAGSTNASLENAKQMGIDLSQAEFCMLSHGHYDHSGGFARLFSENPGMKLYASGLIDEDYCSDSDGKEMRFVGIQKELSEILQDHLVPVKGVTKLDEGIWAVPHNTEGLEAIGAAKHLYKRENGVVLPDGFAHETSFCFETESGLVICNSCSHGGALNIIREVKEALPDMPICAYIGGLHMKGFVEGVESCTFSEEEVAQMAAEIKQSGIKEIHTGHCTGSVALAMLQKELGDMIRPLCTGQIFCIGQTEGTVQNEQSKMPDTLTEGQQEEEALETDDELSEEPDDGYAVFEITGRDGKQHELAVLDEFEFEGEQYVAAAEVVGDIISAEGSYIYHVVIKGEAVSFEPIRKQFDYNRIAKAYMEM